MAGVLHQSSRVTQSYQGLPQWYQQTFLFSHTQTHSSKSTLLVYMHVLVFDLIVGIAQCHIQCMDFV